MTGIERNTMKPEITPAHREILAHLLDPEIFTLGIVPAALAGHHPPGSYEADLPFDWIDPFPVFTHPADPARLLIGVFSDHGWTLVALDHLAHRYCEHPVCGDVVDRRLRELTEIPADAALFAALAIDTSFDTIPLTYLFHIDDYQAAEEKGWTGELDTHTDLFWHMLNPAWPADDPKDVPTWLA
ncbi:hypothetical protein [Nocardia sp. 852002-51244_SCH5132740]|uniref:hypothetical protein n=1 Tax=Nocardia sp. 852002-51244_SCH5132740 TaxID=1834099 RepID=UPI0007EB2CC3|nr:hypothetical protein [Nocardia sp. 852002-51244_SCH5132740]OBB38719.1 hypothetical protein A5748_02295 [Nocardia sp. 852002-51244_SCH5132740]